MLMMGALSLFLFTALAGRLWCGYACPQTVWTEAFLWMERLVEGNRQQQMKLDQAPWSARKLRIKATKQLLWVSFAAWTGFSFVSFFTPAARLGQEIASFSVGPWETFWMFFYGFATYGNAGFLREQVCKYMCPYARFQSAMFDKDTLIISYDHERGEPRGSRKAGSDYQSKGLGACINCTMCVQVCPTGIDIRKGLQYECIGCSACIDVCNDVMAKMDYAPNLIRYTTQNAMDGKPSRIIRPRVLIYAALLAAVGLFFLYLLASRSPLALDVIRDRNQLYRERGDHIENVYTLKVLNISDQERQFHVTASGIEDLKLSTGRDHITVPAGGVLDVPVILSAEEDELEAVSTTVRFTLTADDDKTLTFSHDAKFLGPRP
jgi:cytochrome c oxidase accessory protein FixG